MGFSEKKLCGKNLDKLYNARYKAEETVWDFRFKIKLGAFSIFLFGCLTLTFAEIYFTAQKTNDVLLLFVSSIVIVILSLLYFFKAWKALREFEELWLPIRKIKDDEFEKLHWEFLGKGMKK